MSNAHNPIRLFETVVDDCPYLEGKQSASILVDPEHPTGPDLFAMLSRSGFRRSGDMLYSPKCPDCQACVSVRLPVRRFKASRGQRRVWRKNSDLNAAIEDVRFEQPHFDMYQRYQARRHPDSSMNDSDPEKYVGFIESNFSNSRLLCLYHDTQLISVSVIDQFDGGLSAVYTFFEPEYSNRSLGIYAILYLIKLAKLKEIPYIYLGYWVDGSKTMDYKRQFKPMQGYKDRHWVDLNFE